MNKSISLFVAGILVGVVLAAVGFAVMLRIGADPGGPTRGALVLKLGHALDTSHPVHKAMEFMKQRLEELSGGDVTIDIYPSGVLGSEVQCIEQLQNGSLAMTKTSAAAMENFIPAMSVFGLPYVFRDEDHYWNVLNGEVGRALLQQGEGKFLRGLCYYDAGSRNFYTKDRPIRTPEDLKGLKIRTMNSKTAMDMVKAMGGAPTPIAWGSSIRPWRRVRWTGRRTTRPVSPPTSTTRSASISPWTGSTRIPDILMMSDRVWKKLDPQVQAWVQEAADDSAAFQRTLWQEKTAESLDQARAEGVTVYEVDVAAFAAQVAPMLAAVEDGEVRDLLEQIAEVK